MGPGSWSVSSGSSLRPRFPWDIKNVPWANGLDDQTEFAESVHRWQASHANLPDGTSNKISLKNQGIVLLSHLYGQARDLCKPISYAIINSENGVETIIAAIH